MFFKKDAPPPVPATPAHRGPTPDANGAAKSAESAKGTRSTAFGDIMGVLMRSPPHRKLTLEVIEQFVEPALATGQFSIAEAHIKEINRSAPVSLVIWASVSPEIDQRPP